MSVLRARPLASTAATLRRRPARTNRASQRPRGSTQIVGSSQQSGGVRWSPVVAGTQAEVRSGEGKGGGSPARAGRCARRCHCGRCGGRKEPSPRCVGRGSALPGPLLWARSSAPGAPGGGGRGAPPRARPARGSAAQWRLGAERRSRLRSRPSEPAAPAWPSLARWGSTAPRRSARAPSCARRARRRVLRRRQGAAHHARRLHRPARTSQPCRHGAARRSSLNRSGDPLSESGRRVEPAHALSQDPAWR